MQIQYFTGNLNVERAETKNRQPAVPMVLTRREKFQLVVWLVLTISMGIAGFVAVYLVVPR